MDLPTSTVVNRFVPKEKFYSKTEVSPKVRQLFISEIEKITWSNKIAPSTLNISSGKLLELQVFEVQLKSHDISESVLRHIDKHIPYPILFIIKKDFSVKAAISFKEQNQRVENNMKVDTYFSTNWGTEVNLQLKGSSVDSIYQNYLYQIAPQLKNEKNPTAKQAVESHKVNLKVQKQIDQINKQMKTEPSIAKKQELARQRHQLEEDLKGDQ